MAACRASVSRAIHVTISIGYVWKLLLHVCHHHADHPVVLGKDIYVNDPGHVTQGHSFYHTLFITPRPPDLRLRYPPPSHPGRPTLSSPMNEHAVGIYNTCHYMNCPLEPEQILGYI